MAAAWLTRLPSFRGELSQDAKVLDIAELDFGKIRQRRPAVVLKPATVEDVVSAVQFCRREGIALAARGSAHSAGAQMMAPEGLVIDMKSMGRVLSMGDDFVEVEGGIMWRQLLEATLERGLTPPVVTDWLGVTVGGTLSMGGFGFMSFHRGTQMDHILELEVVTGEGERVTCSPTRNVELFDAVRGTHGQFGIIVRAKLAVERAPQAIQVTQCTYGDVRVMLADFMRLSREVGTDLIHAFAAQKTEASIRTKMNSTERLNFRPEDVAAAIQSVRGPWVYNLEVCDLIPAEGKPRRAPLDPSTLQCLPGLRDTWSMSWKEFCLRLPPLILEEQYRGAAPHPEICIFVPFAHAPDFLASELERLHPERDIGNGPVLIFPIDRRKVSPSLFMLPQNDTHCLFFGLLRRADPPTPERIAQQLADNERIYGAAQQVGTVRYCCDVVPESAAFWKQHFGPHWPRMVELKRKYDPDSVLCSSWGRATLEERGGKS
ncbi:FAD-binding protein [Hyalangium rubrum]|uniref:FAD-binding protein n=1 Tax=Hyalangium rubrum TaxID=3103134 RepID=A0ABU5H7W5_9BACT|nr:FAD-binding protein [Hyalangium sp. s54d21]MDY7229550.1 FAD-binding protein [Hyalangium sp. s54d21]